MQCVKPITLYNGVDPLVVPCGKCVACRIAKSREWALRLLWEGESHEGLSLFVTLTYDEQHLPKPPSIEKYHLQNFVKRLRKNTGKKIKYYACGEYGDRTLRPHYHIILFGLDACLQCCCCRDHALPMPADGTGCREIYDAWGKGHVDIGGLTYESARYVAGYIHKRRTHIHEPVKAFTKPFGLQSQGLGLQFAQEHSDQLHEYLSCSVHGITTTIPRYFINKLLIDKEKLQGCAFEKRILRIRDKGGIEFDDDVARSNVQREMNYKAKLGQKGRKL